MAHSCPHPMICFAANPQINAGPGGFDPLSGVVAVHQAHITKYGRVFWDVVNPYAPHPHRQLERLVKRIKRGLIYITGTSTHPGAIRYDVDIETISSTLPGYPDVLGVPDWRQHYLPNELSRLYWLEITGIRNIPDLSPCGLKKESDGTPYQRSFVQGYVIFCT